MSESNSYPGNLPEGEILRPNDWAEPAAWMLGLAAGLIGVFFLVVSPSPHSQLGGSLRPLLGLAWLAFGVMAASGARAGVVVGKDGIVVRTRFRQSSYRWAEIRGFDLQSSLTRPPLCIHLRDTRDIRSRGFAPKSATEHRRGEAMVAELNRRASFGQLVPTPPNPVR
jgi:hypothetical protein